MLDSSAVDAPTMLGTRTIVIEVGVRWIRMSCEPGVDSPVFAAFHRCTHTQSHLTAIAVHIST